MALATKATTIAFVFVTPINHTHSLFFVIFDSSVALQLAKVPESPDQATFVRTTTTIMDRQTDYFTPAHARWVKWMINR